MSLSTPVGLVIYNRPDLTQKVLASIRKAEPRTLFVVADGPRTPDDRRKCDEARSIIESVDWQCDVLTDFSDVNLGCGRRAATGFDWIFSQVEEAILLEDDILPADSFFTFCQTMLDRYRDDERVMHVNGENSANLDRTKDSYYFSKYVHTSGGWASWRRAWAHYDYSMTTWPEFRASGLFKQVCDSGAELRYWQQVFDQMHTDPQEIDTWDYQWVYACWTQSGLAIAPNKNLISNMGYNRPDSTHAGADDPRSRLPTTDIWEIHHPKFVTRSREADQRSFEVIFGGPSDDQPSERRPSLRRRIKGKLRTALVSRSH